MTRHRSATQAAAGISRPVSVVLRASPLAVVLILAGCAEQADPITLPNPAAVFCESEGGTYEIRQGEDGARGVCILEDGTEMDAWDYFRAKGGE